MSNEELSREDADSLNAVLSFYGSELTSHAGIAMASVIAFLTLIQVRLNLKDPSPFAIPTLLLIMTIVMMVGLYAVVRIAIYGALSSAILSYAFVKDFNDFWNSKGSGLRRLPTARMNEYAIHSFEKRYHVTPHFYNLKRSEVWLLIVPASLVVSLLLLYVVV